MAKASIKIIKRRGIERLLNENFSFELERRYSINPGFIAFIVDTYIFEKTSYDQKDVFVKHKVEY
jgi:hypothetical protein